MIKASEFGLAPWGASSWHGSFVTTDDCELISTISADDVAYVNAYGATNPSDWDGSSAAIVRLKDGRYVSWETWWGPTGNGFCEDAYGGDTDVIVSRTLEAATRAISEKARELLTWNTDAESK